MTLKSTSSDEGLNKPDPQATNKELTEKPANNHAGFKVNSRSFGKQTLLHGREPAANQVQVIFNQLSLRQVEGHSAGVLTNEQGGVFLGIARGQDSRYIVEIAASLPVQSDDSGPVHFTFTADTWARLHRERAERYPELDVVGWYHTHPDLGVFFSADDVIVHRAAFVMPWHFGMVLDPIRGECCLIGWSQEEVDLTTRELAGLNGFYERLDEQPDSAFRWQVVPSSIWKKRGYSQGARLPRGYVHTLDDDWLLLPPISPWWGVILGGLSLLISLILLIERILAGI